MLSTSEKPTIIVMEKLQLQIQTEPLLEVLNIKMWFPRGPHPMVSELVQPPLDNLLKSKIFVKNHVLKYTALVNGLSKT